MSVQCNTYVILGIQREFESGTYERYEPFMDSAFKPRQAGLVVLADGMNGDYTIIGHVLAVSDNHQGLDGVVALDIPPKKLVKSIKEEIMQHFGIECDELQHIVVSHYR